MHTIYSDTLKLEHNIEISSVRILDIFLVFFVSRDLELGPVAAVSPFTKSFFPISVKFSM